MTGKRLVMTLFEKTFCVCRLNSKEEIPSWALKNEFYSITKTFEELSVVCVQENIPENVKCERDWRILKVEGPLDFSIVGILSAISSILARVGVSIFAISTFDTDYILVKEKDIDEAVKALAEEGYDIGK